MTLKFIHLLVYFVNATQNDCLAACPLSVHKTFPIMLNLFSEMATLLVLLLGCLVGALGEDHQLVEGMISSPPPPYHDIRTTVEPSQSTKWPIVEPETEQPAIIENVTDRSDNSTSEPEKRPDNYFDLLIFTQHWPYTTCLDWEEKRHGSCSEIGDKLNISICEILPPR